VPTNGCLSVAVGGCLDTGPLSVKRATTLRQAQAEGEAIRRARGEIGELQRYAVGRASRYSYCTASVGRISGHTVTIEFLEHFRRKELRYGCHSRHLDGFAAAISYVLWHCRAVFPTGTPVTRGSSRTP
jgi:hypothetical protein